MARACVSWGLYNMSRPARTLSRPMSLSSAGSSARRRAAAAKNASKIATSSDNKIGSWRYPLTAGRDLPAARLGHSAVLLRSCLFVFGGASGLAGAHLTGGLAYFDDVWALDLAAEVPIWRRVATEGAAPPPRRGHSCVAVAGRYLLVFGGDTREGESDELYCLDLAAGRTALWRLVDTDPPPPEEDPRFVGLEFDDDDESEDDDGLGGGFVEHLDALRAAAADGDAHALAALAQFADGGGGGGAGGGAGGGLSLLAPDGAESGSAGAGGAHQSRALSICHLTSCTYLSVFIPLSRDASVTPNFRSSSCGR